MSFLFDWANTFFFSLLLLCSLSTTLWQATVERVISFYLPNSLFCLRWPDSLGKCCPFFVWVQNRMICKWARVWRKPTQFNLRPNWLQIEWAQHKRRKIKVSGGCLWAATVTWLSCVWGCEKMARTRRRRMRERKRKELLAQSKIDFVFQQQQQQSTNQTSARIVIRPLFCSLKIRCLSFKWIS